MKKIFIIITTIALQFLAVSCVEEDIPQRVMESGLPVTARLSFGMTAIDNVTVITKAADLNSYSDIKSLFLFIFNADGTKCEQVEELNESQLYDDGIKNDGHHYRTAEIHTTSGEKKIYAVANYTSVQNWKNFASEIRKYGQEALAGKTADEIGKSLFYLIDRYTEDKTTIDFSTAQMIFTGTDNIYINKDGSTEDDKPLKLQRIVANIEFNIVNGHTQEGNSVAFSLENYRIYNLPSITRLSPNRSAEENAEEADPKYYYNSTELTRMSTTESGYSFEFFMPENIQFDSKNGLTAFHQREEWDYTGNEGASPENKKFTHAEGNATFVVINGEYAEYDNSNNLVRSGNTSYTVHLGDFSPEYRSEHADNPFGNYSVRRNCSYRYTVTINGADSIVAEAETEDGSPGAQQGAEGSIVNIGDITKSFSLDAHYEQILLEYNLSNIRESLAGVTAGDNNNNGIDDVDEAIGNYLMLHIESPFQNGIVEIYPYTLYSKAVFGYADKNSTEANKAAEDAKKANLDGIADYKWVEFYPQFGNTSLSPYPGLPLWKNNGQDINGNTDNEHLIDAYDLCVKLGKVVRKLYDGENVSTGNNAEDGITVQTVGNEYHAYFTGFVDEYFYYNHPLTGDKLTKWSDFVNKDARIMMISMEVKSSEDGNSISSSVHTNILQRSIQTFYDDSRAENLAAFGLETFNETPLMKKGNYVTLPNNPNNGRQNSLDIIGIQSAYYSNSYWDSYIDQSENGFIQSIGNDESRKLPDAYRNTDMAWSAFLSRNRDLNGNGKIDWDEVRWYLPSANEYLRIGMGSQVMPSEVQLYDSSVKSTMKPDPDYPHLYVKDGVVYYTSTNDKRTFWAMEKGSYGQQEDIGNTADEKGRYPIRCVRLLPAGNLDDLTQVPSATFVTKYKEYTIEVYEQTGTWWGIPQYDWVTKTVRNYIIDCRNVLVPSLYRPTPANYPLLPHNEDDPANRFYDGFVISRDFLDITYSLDDAQNQTGDERVDPCSSYSEENDPEEANAGAWRVPNLSELTIMASNPGLFLNGIYGYTASSTQFSNTAVKEGFIYNNENGNISCGLDGRTSFLIRCVRDATEAELNNAATY